MHTGATNAVGQDRATYDPGLRAVASPSTTTPATQPLVVPSSSFTPETNQPAAPPPPATPPPKPQVPVRKKVLFFKKRWVIISALSIVIIAAAALILTRLNNPVAHETNVSERFKSQPIPLGDLAKSSLSENRSIQINGQLNVNGSLVMKPSTQPANPVPGQIYYDQDTNQLSYFNGTEFVSLLGGSSTAVQNTVNNNVTNNNATLTGSGTPGRIPKFNANQNLTDSLISDNGVNVNINGNLNLVGTSLDGEITMFPVSQTPNTPDSSDPDPNELGVKFRTDVGGYIRGIRFYKSQLNTGTHTGSLWSASGVRLATAIFTNESESGWQEVRFATPVAVTANTTYVASYFAPTGHYAFNPNFFSSTLDNDLIHGLANGEDGPNGVFRQSASGGFPNTGFNASNYWVDVVFNPSETHNQFRINGVQISSADLSNNNDLAKRSTSQIFTGVNTFRNGTDGTPFSIQTSSGLPLFTASTQNKLIILGPAAGDADGVTLVLGNRTADGDPGGNEGAMYYNRVHKMFRCYRDGAWSACADFEADQGFSLYDEFMGGQTNSFTNNDNIGSLGWNAQAIGANGTISFNPTTPTPIANRPGVLALQTPAVANQGTSLTLGTNGGSMLIQKDNAIKTSVALGSITDQVLRVGLHNETTSTTPPTSGVWWEANPAASANWRYCRGDGAAAICTASTIPLAVNTWVKLEIRVTATGAGTSAATFLINGGSIPLTAATIDITNRVSPAFSCYSTVGTAQNCYWDYFQLRGLASAAR